MMPESLNIWRSALRPKTLWAAVAPVVMASAMAWTASVFHGPSFAVILSTALLIQIGTNLANDYFDFRKGSDTAGRIGPVRVTQAGLLRPEAVRLAFILVFAAATLLGAYLVLRGGWPILAIGISSVLLGILYTGGPFPLAYVGLGDVFAFLYFGPIAAAGTWYLMAGTWTPESILAGCAAGFFSTALLTVNNFRDIVSDRRSGKKTLAVRFGARFARIEFLLCLTGVVIIPCVFIYRFGASWWLSLAGIPVLLRLPAALAAMWADPDESREFGDRMNRLLAEVGRLEILYAILFSAAWIIAGAGR